MEAPGLLLIRGNAMTNIQRMAASLALGLSLLLPGCIEIENNAR